MKTKKIEKLGINPSLLGFGCMRFPLDENGNIDEAESEKMLDKAISSGVTYIDTAYPYHNGDSEPFVGKVLKKYNREDFFLATKLPIWDVSSKEDAKKVFLDQLKRLDVDYVDFYLLHALDKEKWDKVIKYDILDLCEKFKDEGKIRYFGFSFHDEYPVFKEILEYYDWDFCQLQLNYMDMDIQAGMKGYLLAEKYNIPLIVMEPIKGGALASLPGDITDKFKKYNSQASISSWALRYIASLPNVKVVLSGMSTYNQVLDNLAVFENFEYLNEDELTLIQEVKDTLKSRTQNGCTGCGYCMPCPFGVDIPTNFKYWNNGYIYGGHEMFKTKLANMAPEKKAENCKQCGACEKMCPQQLLIREDLKRVCNYIDK
ncbi:MAG: aldo/keto reductase [Thomasclavelia sp.]|uniref:aldo/keto reductase n=1 Tax=Thomasclavelia sp. TaxID=3025757 RepID=UPI0039A364B5